MSNMVVNTNIMALNSHRSLKGVGGMQAKASSRLSSGLRINSAADDAAGLAISEKMRAQIRGLDMASKNAQDAISLIQTAEGGMQEIDNMLQRIRELTVQASNDTNDQPSGDRVKIQDEINQLVAEIDSMADRVEFNKKNVINGDYNDSGQVNLPDVALSQPAPTVAATEAPEELAKRLLSVIVNGADFAALASSTVATTIVVSSPYLAAIEAALADPTTVTDWDGLVDVTVAGLAKTLDDVVKVGGTNADADAAAALTGIIAALGDVVAAMAPQAPTLEEAVDGFTGNSTNMATSLQAIAADTVVGDAIAVAQSQWNALLAATTKEDIATAWKDFTTALGSDPAAATLYATSASMDLVSQLLADKLDAAADSIAPTVAGIKLFFQVGANAQQKLELNINSVKSDALGIGNGSGTTTIDVDRLSGSEITDLIKGLDDAISYVTTERSKLGAAQNRLEYTIKSLDISSENLSASESRIRDTDMAKEMMNFTKANVLQQAATSMLAQANQAPQMILKLLG